MKESDLSYKQIKMRINIFASVVDDTYLFFNQINKAFTQSII